MFVISFSLHLFIYMNSRPSETLAIIASLLLPRGGGGIALYTFILYKSL